MKKFILILVLFFSSICVAQTGNTQDQNPLVSDIVFSGNNNISSSVLLEAMYTHPSRWWNKQRFNINLLQDDLNALITLYNNRGFLDAAVQSWDTTRVSSGKVRISIILSEGFQSVIGSISFQGNQVLPTTELRQITQLESGEPFSFLKVSESTWSLINRYAEIGYIDALVDPRLEMNETNVHIAYQIQEGEPVYVDSLIISGNEKTRNRVIRRELEIKPGDLLTHQRVVGSQQNLYKTGLFNSVQIIPQRVAPSTSYRNVTIRVLEAETGELNFGIGYGSAERARLTLEVLQGNIFGTGQKVGLRTRGSFREVRLEGIYTNPYFLFWHLTLDHTTYFRRQMETNYAVNRIGTETTIGKQLFEYTRLSSTLRIENNTFTHREASLTDSTNERLRTLSVGISRDTRNNLFNPTQGSYLNVTSLLAGQFLQGTNSYVRFSTDLIKYIPVSDIFTAATNLSVGRLYTIGTSPTVPIYERFFAGGDYSLRGYKNRTVGPMMEGEPIGGYVKLVSQNEIRMKIYKELHAALFLDAGNVWSRFNMVNTEDIRVGYGFGLRYTTPLGMIRVDYGLKLDPRPGEEKAVIHLTLGQTL